MMSISRQKNKIRSVHRGMHEWKCVHKRKPKGEQKLTPLMDGEWRHEMWTVGWMDGQKTALK